MIAGLVMMVGLSTALQQVLELDGGERASITFPHQIRERGNN